MRVNQVLNWMMLIAGGVLSFFALCLAVLMLIYRRELDWKYVLLGISMRGGISQ
jgi:uncharacterized membrane protein